MKVPGLRAVFTQCSLTLPWSIVLIILAVALNTWASLSADRDFFLPNPFPWLCSYLLLLFLLTGFLRSTAWRSTLRVSLGVLPVAVMLIQEVRLSRADASMNGPIMRVADPVLRYQFRPNAPGMNDLGIADSGHAIPKPPGVYRIVLLGDSVPNDSSIPEGQRFQRVLEDSLNASGSSRRYEVVNVSCVGYNTTQEVQLLEKVGLQYDPDFVLVAYVLNDPFMQDAFARRFGNSYFIFRLMPLYYQAIYGSNCRLFSAVDTPFAFGDVVTVSFDRLALLAKLHHFGVAVAALPIVAPFDDPVCDHLYSQVGEAAKAAGFSFLPIVDAFRGEDPALYLKPHTGSQDVTHPNALGHRKMGEAIARGLLPLLHPSSGKEPSAALTPASPSAVPVAPER